MGCCADPMMSLGALTAEEAVSQAIAEEGGRDINPADASGWLSPSNPGWPSVLSSGQISASAYSPTCESQPAPKVNLFQTASGLSLGTASAGVGILAANPALLPMISVPVAGAIIAGAAVVIGIIETIFAHHAAAAKQEQQLGCAGIAGWNNSISLIQQAVQNGQMQPADAAAAMDSLYSKISGFLAPADSHSPYCSAACELLIEAKAIAIYQKSLYESMAPIATSGGLLSPSSGGFFAPSSAGVNVGGVQISPMLLLLGGGLLLFAMSR